MDARTEPSVEELRRESERTRAALAGTVGELRERVVDGAAELKTMVSPAHIKKEIKSYVRDEREHIMQSLDRKVRENPLQAVAVGAALAYPAWGLLRAIPGPLMLIGAGLWLTSSRGKRSMKQWQTTAADAMEQGTAKASEYASAAQSDLAHRTEKARETLSNVGAAVSSNLEAVADKARSTAHDLRDSLASNASTAVNRATAEAESIGSTAARTASDVKDRAVAMGATSRNAVLDFVNQNPLLVAGVGAAVGAFIAASFPASQAENRVFGAPSDGLKDQARKAAAQGVEKAKDMAANVVGDVAAAAAREGLDAAGVKAAVNTVVEGVKSVADRGVETALAGVAPSHPASSQFNPSRSQS